MRVLIVEDERQMAEQLRKCLERGYSVILANDGEHGLDLARTVDHDLLIPSSKRQAVLVEIFVRLQPSSV
jgi:DNA-binding response OmpR family regulator